MTAIAQAALPPQAVDLETLDFRSSELEPFAGELNRVAIHHRSRDTFV